MADVPLPGRDSIEAQREMFRMAARDCGLTIAAIAQRSPLKESTLKGWRDGSAMPAWALGALGEAGVPDHLLSMVLAPFGRHVATDRISDGDLEELGRESAHYLADHADARADGTITPSERSRLSEGAARLAGIAMRVARGGRA
jgi:hypothetical protein